MRQTFERYSIALAALALACALATVFTPTRVGAQGRATTPVQIVGPIPVPITGNVGISGVAGVEVTNTPSVSISGTPQVTIGNNTAANPLFVRNVDNPALQPVEINFDRDIADGLAQTVCPINVYTVPPGKTLVIEYVNFVGIGEPGAPPETLGFAITGMPDPHYEFITTQRGDSQIGALFYADSEPTRIYLGPSTAVGVCAYRGTVKTGAMTARAKLSGHLVDTP